MDSDSFVLSMKTENNIKDIKNLEVFSDCSNSDEKHEVFSNKNKKNVGEFKLETPKKFWIDDSVCLRIKIFSFTC